MPFRAEVAAAKASMGRAIPQRREVSQRWECTPTGAFKGSAKANAVDTFRSGVTLERTHSDAWQSIGHRPQLPRLPGSIVEYR